MLTFAPVVVLLLLFSARVTAQQPPELLYIYRDSLKSGVDSSYRAIENDGAQICARLECPNPYLGLESLTGPHEAWWVNAFETPADTARVREAYAANRRLMEMLNAVAGRKAAMIGKPVEGYAVHRPDLDGGASWHVAGARYMVVALVRDGKPNGAAVWRMADSTLYALRLVKTRGEADAIARTSGARVFAIRPNWSMPSAEWIAADSAFWRGSPAEKALPARAQVARPDSLLDRMIGSWVLQGMMAGQQTTHDVTFQWVLGFEYVQMHEISRERTRTNTPMYEAIVYIGRDSSTKEYAALWLDNTAYGAFAPAGTGHGFAAGDSIAFVFTSSPTSHVYTRFNYNRSSDLWEWHLDNEDSGVLKPFARVTLRRKE